MKNLIMKRLLPLVLFAGAAAVAVAVFICPNCGYEYEPGATVCRHCGAELAPSDDSAEPVMAPPSPESSDNGISLALISRACSGAEKRKAEGHHEACFLETRNAIAWTALLPDGADALRRRLHRLNAESRKDIPRGLRECPVCNGSGKRTRLFITLKGKAREQVDPASTCPACDGRGLLAAYATEQELARKMRSAEAAFSDMQKLRLLSKWHTIWLPRGISRNLTVREEAALKTSAPPLCSTCYGVGWTGCEFCHGTGRVPCSNPNCVMGQEVCPVCGGSKKEAVESGGRTVIRSCSHCRQLGVSPCETCGGQGFLFCEMCDGKGRFICSRCNGSGTGVTCERCDGQGLQQCSRCEGSGKYKNATCRTCGGEGVVLCKSCKGFGCDQ
ncbi:MAG: zinc-ribbon domain-containing protein [Verrucomicrobia bacterium]|nr:zinc-ribbon domain-containing protein [Verrucomicrobiota bacterium]